MSQKLTVVICLPCFPFLKRVLAVQFDLLIDQITHKFQEGLSVRARNKGFCDPDAGILISLNCGIRYLYLY